MSKRLFAAGILDVHKRKPMARKRVPAPSRIAEMFSTSEDRVEGTRKTFDASLTTLTNARAYGTETHVAAARVLTEASEVYADALQTHAHLVVDYATERSS